MARFLVYGDYSVEKKGFDEFRNDLKILGIVDATDLEKAKEKLIDECSIYDINDIENNIVTIVEILGTEVVVDLETL